MGNQKSFRDLVYEMYEEDMREQQQDGWDDIEEEEERTSDGLDPAFSSWEDYYNFMYG
jgi:hypothetical protein